MLTIFSTPKPFAGHVDVIQRNAIRSWQRLHSEVEIILVGDDAGSPEVCKELGLRHIPVVRKNAQGTKYLASVYDQAQQAARHDILCHVNCDIVLMADFLQAVQRLRAMRERFLMAGQRWDVEVMEPLDFERDWETRLRQLALRTNRQRPAQWIDYFVFPKGLYYRQIPEFVIGRPGWDNWLLWYPRTAGVPVVDASRMVVAVHQNHDYGYHPEGEAGVWQGEEARENYRLYERKFATLEHASYLLCSDGLRRNYREWFARPCREVVAKFYRMWFGLLNATRPVRQRLGLRSAANRGR
jgi:hypothetical protein